MNSKGRAERGRRHFWSILDPRSVTTHEHSELAESQPPLAAPRCDFVVVDRPMHASQIDGIEASGAKEGVLAQTIDSVRSVWSVLDETTDSIHRHHIHDTGSLDLKARNDAATHVGLHRRTKHPLAIWPPRRRPTRRRGSGSSGGGSTTVAQEEQWHQLWQHWRVILALAVPSAAAAAAGLVFVGRVRMHNVCGGNGWAVDRSDRLIG